MKRFGTQRICEVALACALVLTAASDLRAACGCDKPPPPRANVRPFAAYPDQAVNIFDDRLQPGRRYTVLFTSRDGTTDWSRGRAVAKRDFALFSLGRLPDDAKGRLRAEQTAERVRRHLGDARMTDREAGGALGIGNAIRYAATTGTVAIRWEGARAPIIWTVPAAEIDAADARRELARRHLHVFGPTTAESFAPRHVAIKSSRCSYRGDSSPNSGKSV